MNAQFYHQDCPAVKKYDTNKSRWWDRLWFVGRRSIRVFVPAFIVVPRRDDDLGLFRTFKCEACGTRIHVDL